MAASIQDWAIELNKVKILEELPRSSGALKKYEYNSTFFFVKIIIICYLERIGMVKL